jgi:hypothetical protein
MPTKIVKDGRHRIGFCPKCGTVSMPHTGCEFSASEKWDMAKEVPRAILFERMRRYLLGLSPAERKLVRDHIESQGTFPDTEDAREFLDILRKEK